MEIFLLFEIQMVNKVGEEERDTEEVLGPRSLRVSASGCLTLPFLRYASRVMKPLAGEKGSDYHLDLR